MRFVAQCYFQHLFCRRHFKIYWQAYHRHDPGEIFVANMSPILTQMDRDAIPTSRLHNFYRAHGIWMIPAARITDRRNMVDIDAEP
jgi:hypothetical protein